VFLSIAKGLDRRFGGCGRPQVAPPRLSSPGNIYRK